jgi:glycosyltransferase involved in cell wall biosynthesis
MKVTAILAVRNDESYLANCLRNLVQNNVDFIVIDHGSTDDSKEILRRREFARNLVDRHELQFDGVFSLSRQLEKKMEIVESLDTDWVVHLDADEVMHSNAAGERLNEALARLGASGWNIVNFDEFVFLPVDGNYVPDWPGHQPILHYYYFNPSAPRLMRAWKKASGFSPLEHGGHRLTGTDLRIAPEFLVLRHYIVLSQEHAYRKYAARSYSERELARGWHRLRVNQPIGGFRFPPSDTLRKLSAPDDYHLDRSDPWKAHFWQLSRD